MLPDDLDALGSRRSEFLAAGLEAVGVKMADATILRASPQGQERWELWIASEIGLIVAIHDPGRYEIGPGASLELSEIVPWDSVGPLTVTTRTSRWQRDNGIGTEITVTFRGREFHGDIGPGVPRDDSGLAAFTRACLARQAARRGPPDKPAVSGQ